MTTDELIESYIASQPESKQSDLRTIHELALAVQPDCRIWFLDGKDENGKVVSNPNIGYGFYTIKYADGSTKAFYQVGLSANTAGISVYILGLEDKTYLARTFGESLGKASISGYCIKFKSLNDIDLHVLQAAIQHGFDARRK